MRFSAHFCALAAFVAALSPALAQDAEPGSPLDPSSYSNVDQFQPLHMTFDIGIVFESSMVHGTVEHTIRVLDESAAVVYMDVWDAVMLEMAEFRLEPIDTDGGIMPAGLEECPSPSDGWVSLDYEVSTPNPNIGNALAVNLPCTMPEGTIFFIRFAYYTMPDSTAMDWLRPEQTAGKKLPYMYSLCQMNFCRDFAPMMDTPSQKVTYNATVIAPSEFVVRMTANATDSMSVNETHTSYTFVNEIKMQSYLIGIVVGDLASKSLTDRISIVSESAYLESAAEEFEDAPAILAMAEEYLSPYIWGVYDILIMPPSFPWAGMEQPLINYYHPTLIAGDKSHLSVLFHEITHSWFGNDVGCQNWEHFWINEGMNTFMERKLIAMMQGEVQAKNDYFVGNNSMYDTMLSYGLDDTYSSLFPQIGDDNPENSFSIIPYEKGSQFAYYMESLLGEEAMQNMLRTYLITFSQSAINHTQFQTFYEDFVNENFEPADAERIIEETQWTTWVTEPGLPPVAQDFATSSLDEAKALAASYIELGGEDRPEEYESFSGFSSAQKEAFIQALDANDAVDADLLAYVDSDLMLTDIRDPTVKTKWYILGIEKMYEPVYEPARMWMSEQGRSAYVTPTYRALVSSGNCSVAEMWFEENKNFYNSYVVGGVERALEECDEEGGGNVDGGGGGEGIDGPEDGNGGPVGDGESSSPIRMLWVAAALVSLVIFVTGV